MWELVAEASLLVGIGILVFPSLSDVIVLISCVFTKHADEPECLPACAPRLLVFVPAHNEERLVGRAVMSILEAEYPSECRKTVVIADNCTDRTEEVVRDCGVQCLVRVAPDEPGKPQALAWAIELALAWNSFDWDACIVVDADSIVDRGFLEAIGSTPNLRSVICQARNGVENEFETWLTVLGGLLVRARYDVLFRCKSRRGLNCPTAGNGTVVGRDVLSSGWQAFSLAEGWELYASATLDGRHSIYIERARIASQEARSISQSASQRRRWTAGRWHVLTQLGGKIARSRNINVLQRLDTLCELSNPGPVSHIGGLFLILSVAVGTMGSKTILVGSILASIGIAPYLAVYGLALGRHPRRREAIKALVRLPAYALWRLPLGLWAMLVPRDGLWEKTRRH